MKFLKLFDETLNIQNKMQSVFEIINTPGIVIENVENDDDDFPTMITLRRTHKVFCNYCPNIWGTVLYGGNGNRVCFRCEYEIAKEVRRREKNIKIISDTIEKKKLVHEQIIDIGMHPCRVFQTQLADTLSFFRQSSK